MMKTTFFLELLTTVHFVPIASFSVGFHKAPRAFVEEVIVPWYSRAKVIHYRRFGYEDEQRNLPPVLQLAALRYQRQIGIPQLLFREWVSIMLQNDEDGDIYFRECDQVATWGTSESVCIEGGDFDWLQMHCRIVRERIRNTKETILTAIESSEVLALPSEISVIPRAELLDSHEYDELFQNSLAKMLDKWTLASLPWETRTRLDLPWTDWFVSISHIRTENYFPRETWRSHAMRKELHEIFEFDGLLESSSYRAVQTHLVKHLDEWRLNIDSIPTLYTKIAVPLLFRGCNDFISKEAMKLSPKELLRREREAILDMQFASLDDLDDTPRVKVMRTEREVQDIEKTLNTTIFHYRSSSLSNPAWSACKRVAVALCNAQDAQVAVGEFSFGFYRNGHTARLGRTSTVTIEMRNKTEPIDDSLISLCKHYHDDFLYGWRMENVEKEDPEWFRREQGRLE